jgi:hypothetical protein
LVLFQVGTELVTPTEGWVDVPTDGAVTVPTLCPELPIVPCWTGAPGVLFVVVCAPVAEVCALAASGDAANPTAINAATKRLVLVMADPFRRGLSFASGVRLVEPLSAEQSYNSAPANMCRDTIVLRTCTPSRCLDERLRRKNDAFAVLNPASSARRQVNVGSVSGSASAIARSRAFYPLVTAITAVYPKSVAYILIE